MRGSELEPGPARSTHWLRTGPQQRLVKTGGWLVKLVDTGTAGRYWAHGYLAWSGVGGGAAAELGAGRVPAGRREPDSNRRK